MSHPQSTGAHVTRYRGERGLLDYGKPLVCADGATATVRQASADEDRLWLFVDETTAPGYTHFDPGKAALLLSPRGVADLRDRLQAYLDDVQYRGGRRRPG